MIDIHKIIDSLPHPKKGWVLPGYKYCGPSNPLQKELTRELYINHLKLYLKTKMKNLLTKSMKSVMNMPLLIQMLRKA